MAKTMEQLKAQSAEVKNATVVGENTATRVGNLFNDIVEKIEQETADGATTTAKLAPLAVTTEKLANGAVTGDKIAAGTITEDNIEDKSLSQNALAKNAVATDIIQDGAVTSEKLADSAMSQAMTTVINNEAQARAKADEQLNTTIVANTQAIETNAQAIMDEVARAQAAEEANTTAIEAAVTKNEEQGQKLSELGEIVGKIAYIPTIDINTYQNKSYEGLGLYNHTGWSSAGFVGLEEGQVLIVNVPISKIDHAYSYADDKSIEMQFTSATSLAKIEEKSTDITAITVPTGYTNVGITFNELLTSVKYSITQEENVKSISKSVDELFKVTSPILGALNQQKDLYQNKSYEGLGLYPFAGKSCVGWTGLTEGTMIIVGMPYDSSKITIVTYQDERAIDNMLKSGAAAGLLNNLSVYAQRDDTFIIQVPEGYTCIGVTFNELVGSLNYAVLDSGNYYALLNKAEHNSKGIDELYTRIGVVANQFTDKRCGYRGLNSQTGAITNEDTDSGAYLIETKYDKIIIENNDILSPIGIMCYNELPTINTATSKYVGVTSHKGNSALKVYQLPKGTKYALVNVDINKDRGLYYRTFSTAFEQELEETTSRSIVCWGDSLTQGVLYASETTHKENVINTLVNMGYNDVFSSVKKINYVDMLQLLLNSKYNIINMGIGGETIDAIGAREGGLPVYLEDDIVLPETTEEVEIGDYSKFVSAYDNTTKVNLQMQQATSGINPCYLEGIECNLRISGSKYYIKRTSNGSRSTTIPKGTPFLFGGAKKNRNAKIVILWCWQNGGYSTQDELVDKLQRIVGNLGTDKYILIGLHTPYSTSEQEEKLTKVFGNKYFNWRRYISTNAMYDFNITPTVQDIEDMNNGRLPHSFYGNGGVDGIHIISAGYMILGYKIYERIIQLGYITE